VNISVICLKQEKHNFHRAKSRACKKATLVRFQVFVEAVHLKRTAPKFVRSKAKVAILNRSTIQKFDLFIHFILRCIFNSDLNNSVFNMKKAT
jgi:hypothetical protein